MLMHPGKLSLSRAFRETLFKRKQVCLMELTYEELPECILDNVYISDKEFICADFDKVFTTAYFKSEWQTIHRITCYAYGDLYQSLLIGRSELLKMLEMLN